MLEGVLPVARAEMHAAQELHEFRMDAVYAHLENGGFALFLDELFDFLAGLRDDFLDAGRMDPSVQDQFLQGDAGDLAAHRVKARKHDGFRRIVDDQVHARRLFQRADVAAFASDDAAFHLIVGKRHHGNGHFGNVICRTLLDGGDDVFLRLPGRIFLRLGVNFLQLLRDIVPGVFLDTANEVFLGFFLGESGDLFQHALLLIDDLLNFLVFPFQLFVTGLHALFLAFQGFDLLVKTFFLVLQAAFGPL